jgi:hypothetical protein
MRGLSTKLKERMSLSTSGTFPGFLSNAIIANNVIHAHKEGKKKKAMAAPSGSAPPKVSGGVSFSPHQAASSTSAPPPPVGFPPTSAPVPTGSTKGSTTTTTAYVAPAWTTDYWSRLQHLLQLWAYWSLRLIVHCFKEEHRSWSHQPSTPWPAEDCRYQDMLSKLHYYGGNFLRANRSS